MSKVNHFNTHIHTFTPLVDFFHFFNFNLPKFYTSYPNSLPNISLKYGDKSKIVFQPGRLSQNAQEI